MEASPIKFCEYTLHEGIITKVIYIHAIEMGVIIDVHPLFPVPLDNRALDGALSSVFILVSNHCTAQTLKDLFENGWRVRFAFVRPDRGKLKWNGLVSWAAEAFIDCIGQTHYGGGGVIIAHVGVAWCALPDGKLT